MHDDYEISPPGDHSQKRVARERFSAMRELIQSDPDIERFLEEAPQRLQAVQARLGLHMSGGYQAGATPQRSSRGLFRTLIATGAGVLASLVIFSIYKAVPSRVTQPAISVPTYIAGVGERAAITLPDGSRIILAPGTQLWDLSSPAERHVELQGEAFFTVIPNPDVPFSVVSGSARTTVLGTSFAVRRYPSDSVAQVAVVTGKVSTARAAAGEPVILTPGSIATVTDSSMTVRTGEDPASLAAWVDGKLIFEETPVPVMLETIGRWYGYEFQLADSTLTTRHVSMVFRTDQRVEAMEKIRAVLGVTMTFDGQVVTLRPGHARSNTLHRRSPLSPVTTGVGK